MTDVPRRLPQRINRDRVKNVARRMAPGSDDGQTAVARPVTPLSPMRSNRSGGNVTTGRAGLDAVSISNTAPGTGSSTATGDRAVAVGDGSYAFGLEAVADGPNAAASGDYAASFGPETGASGNGSVAIGCDDTGEGVVTNVTNEIKIGTGLHHVLILGTLVLVDTVTHDKYAVTVVSGTLTATPWP